MTIQQMRESNDGQLPAFAWPGGYPMFYVTRDGMTICPECANQESDPSQAPIAGDVYWEGPSFQCDDCQGVIESAYGDPVDPKAR